MGRWLVAALAIGMAGCRSANGVAGASDEILPAQRLEKLGRMVFFDESLSEPPGESCATCHDPEAGFTDARGGATSRGAVDGRAGVRNAPGAMYAAFVPPLHWDAEDETFVGGLFWDGRVDSLEAQAGKPLLNPIEMNNPDRASVIDKVRRAPYAELFRRTFGPNALDDVDVAFDDLTRAVAAFERTPRFAPFTSRYDYYLAGQATLTPAEQRGLAIFEDEHKGNCAACHPSQPGDDGAPPMFTDFTYDNLGIPKNPQNPYYALPSSLNPDGAGYVDHGLAATVGDAAQDGKFRVPTLRNVALSAPYGHNGYFADLHAVVDFYNTRDTRPWPAPEVPATMNKDELGHLGLTPSEVDDLVTFLYALTDGYTP